MATPYEKWYGRQPNIELLRVFRCTCYVLIPKQFRQKLDKKGKQVRFIEYSARSKGYRVLDEKTGKIFTRRDIAFNETDFDHQNKEHQTSNGSKSVQIDQLDSTIITSSSTSNNQVTNEPRRSQRTHAPPVRYGIDEYADNVTQHTACKAIDITEPQTVMEAIRSPQSQQWKTAMKEEYDSLMSNDTWELVELPVNRSPVGCKWVFKTKYDAQGNVERFKGRLVAKGYTQQHGIDYYETFSPVVSYTTVDEMDHVFSFG